MTTWRIVTLGFGEIIRIIAAQLRRSPAARRASAASRSRRVPVGPRRQADLRRARPRPLVLAGPRVVIILIFGRPAAGAQPGRPGLDGHPRGRGRGRDHGRARRSSSSCGRSRSVRRSAASSGALFASRQAFIDPSNFDLQPVDPVRRDGGHRRRRQHARASSLGAVLLTYLPERFRGFDDWRTFAFGVALVHGDDPAAAGAGPEPTASARVRGPQRRGRGGGGRCLRSRRATRRPPRSRPHRRAPRGTPRGRQRHAALRRRGGARRGRLHALRGRDPRPDRPQRRRQDDLLQRDDRRLHADAGRDPLRRRADRRAQAAPDHPARHRPHVPEHPALPRDDGAGERHGRRRRPPQDERAGRAVPVARAGSADELPRSTARAGRRAQLERRTFAKIFGCRGTRSRSGGARPGDGAAALRRDRRPRRRARPATCPTATSGGWRSPGRWPPSRSCSASTSRPPASTRPRRTTCSS